MITVKALYQYPIKGCAGHPLLRQQVTKRGFHFDRRWMVVDANGKFVTQRSIRSMCLIQPYLADGRVYVAAPKMGINYFVQDVTRAENHGDRLQVQVWDSTCEAIEVHPRVSKWFTEFLSRERPGQYRLVQIADDFSRPTSKGNAELSFADGYAFLVASDASLADVNSRMDPGEPITMDRFRPGIVFTGCSAFEEDRINRFETNGVTFEGQKLCDRCSVPSIVQATADVDSRPLRALSTYRRWADAKGGMKVWFGRNFNHTNEGVIRIGDEVKIL